MLLHRIHLNPRSKEARRDLADPYQMHATLCRAFFAPETPCPPNALLWRLEPETDSEGLPRILIQSHAAPDWASLKEAAWLTRADPGTDLFEKLSLASLEAGRAFRFRLRANPCRTANGKRLGLTNPDAQRAWIARKATQHGFALPEEARPDFFEHAEPAARVDIRVTQDQMLVGRCHGGNTIRVFSVLYEGALTVTDPERFCVAVRTGIGHGKVMGLGLLSLAPIQAA